MAMDDFHAKWFNRKATITPPTPEERRQRKMDYLRNLAGISDPEARDRLDTAAGRISAAYQLLGFCVGHTSQSSEAFF